jgi:glucose/arabinose dehydrogenase
MTEFDTGLLITQREGKLHYLNFETDQLTPISGLPNDILVVGQGGLFDVKLSPQYQQDKWIYFTYNKAVGDKGATTLARARLTKNTLTDWQDLLITNTTSSKGVHYGGRITFDADDHVFFSVGDRGHRPNAQDLSKHAGSILRLNLDGSIPKDNPFINHPDARSEIWSYGHRNPHGLFYNTPSLALWVIEHGPRGGDEINLIQPGHNYGWAEISYGKEYWAPIAVGNGTHADGMEQPIQTYIPSIAPSSLIQYQGDHINHLKDCLIVGALALQHLNVITLDTSDHVIGEKRLFSSLNARIRNVIELHTGQLIIATDAGDIMLIDNKS